MKIRLFAKANEISETTRNDLEEKLVSNGYELSNKDDYDLAIAVGGDGTFLKMIHECKFDPTKKFASINTGNLGYLTTMNKDELSLFIQDLNTNNFNVEKIKFLTIKINTNDEYDGSVYHVLNEVSVRNTLFKTLYLSVFINNNLLYKLAGDGVSVSSTIGSTAYNMSLGGSIIDPSFDVTLDFEEGYRPSIVIKGFNRYDGYTKSNQITFIDRFNSTTIPLFREGLE
jgi:NAD+ kinase